MALTTTYVLSDGSDHCMYYCKHLKHKGAHQYVLVYVFKTDPKTKCLITHFTNIRVLTIMYTFMSFKNALVNE